MQERMLVVILATIFISSGHVTGNIPLINARKWPYLQYADLEGYIYDKQPRIYEKSVEYCERFAGVLPSPTNEETWDKSIKIMEKLPKSQTEGFWIGVEYEKNSEGEIIAKNTEGVVLKDSERKMIFSDESITQKITDTKQCVTYVPSKEGHAKWKFQLQACKEIGTTPEARALCVWSSDKYKAQKAQEVSPKFQARTETKPNITDRVINPRSGVDGGDGQVIAGDGETTHRSASSSSTPLAIVIAALVVCCLAGSLYYVSKKRGWNIREVISHRMPYNRPRVSLSGESYSRGQELSDMTSHSRPIHVYEEIIPRNSGMAPSQQASRDNVLSCSSTITIPREPPPQPPTTSGASNGISGDRSKLEDGYLKPSFRRGDFIPGDVRSPLPKITNVFTFPQTKSESPSFLKPPAEKELKYASVETIHTFLGDEKQNDEEYLVEDQKEEQNCEPLVVKMPEKSEESSSKIPAGLNPYVHVNGHCAGELDNDSVFSPVFPYQPSDYENERFLKTVMKKETKQKPPRRSKIQNASGHSTSQSTSQNGAIVYASIPATQEPIYTQIKKKQKTNGITVADVNATAYTPMDGGKEHISLPSMISTTNQDLNNSAAKYYEIPPENSEAI